MKTRTRTKNVAYLAVFLLTISLTLFFIVRKDLSANVVVEIDETISEKMTSSDDFSYKGNVYSIFDYKSTIGKDFSNLYSSNLDKADLNLTFSGDDPIINIVPKEYFMKVGQYTFSGDEYGFYVNTFQEELYFMDGERR